MRGQYRVAVVGFLWAIVSLATFADSPAATPPAPEPLEAGKTVVPLWPADKLIVKGDGGAEVLTRGKSGRVQSVINIHNPSIELRLAPPENRNGAAVLLIPGGGNKTVVVGSEGIDAAAWLNKLGISAFILRYRIQPYDSTVEAVADTQRAVRTIRANAKEWGVDPQRIGVMGFSAGGEQAAWLLLKFDSGQPDAADAIDRFSCRPDFVVMVYAGWKRMDMRDVPKDAPPAFLTSAGLDDAFHARQTVQFYDALFEAGVPVELHIYGHGGHGGGINPRGGIPFGTWSDRFLDWARDLGVMPKEK
ncbi:MAG TPA: alpha/beta hydrolase [Lacipirellulaceae bacterium]|jgi:endo-1,4-beta-xylanase|nr:alpha/beta hydrolase [Lacipirellulaceae bacterium]